jgi:hypothetical protein
MHRYTKDVKQPLYTFSDIQRSDFFRLGFIIICRGCKAAKEHLLLSDRKIQFLLAVHEDILASPSLIFNKDVLTILGDDLIYINRRFFPLRSARFVTGL